MKGGVWLLATALAGASADMRKALQPNDLHALLRARNEACAGCTTDELLAKLQSTDAVGREQAGRGVLDIVVRYCAS